MSKDENVKEDCPPELFIGLTGAVGTDLDKVSEMFASKLQTLGYATEIIILSKLLESINGLIAHHDSQDEYARITALMDAGDKLREKTKAGNAMIKLAIYYVIDHRKNMQKKSNASSSRQAYIFKSLKHPDEVKRLRNVYGKNFWLVSVYSPRNIRANNLRTKISRNNKEKTDYYVAELMKRDEHDSANPLGQNVRDTFSKADVFLNMEEKLEKSIGEFIELLFGNTFHTPSRDESGMMHALAVSIASSSMSRQVGASILTKHGSLISTGINEVPKSNGGHYTIDDANDAREWTQGYDSNTRKKTEALSEFLDKLDNVGWLAGNTPKSDRAKRALEFSQIKGTAFLNLIEYGREVHAEMSALLNAARLGIPVAGCTMYCTTFPCHICAKHIVASGISRLVYIEPYPKSLAEELHNDSITVDENGASGKVRFEPFIGVSPIQYMRLFRMLERKDEYGDIIKWEPDNASLRYAEPIKPYDREDQDADKISKILSDQ